MIRRGFTIVELLITITIMGILLTLAVVGLNATQANARDSERKGDAENIALHFETFYSTENTTSSGYPWGSYITVANLKNYTPDLDERNLRAPGIQEAQPISLVVATNTTATPEGVTPQPSATNDVYVYQPLTATGALCQAPASGECRRFNIYYYQESDNSIQVITSKRQS